MFSNHGGQSTMIFTQLRLKVTSNLLYLARRLRLDPIVGSSAPKPTTIYTSLWFAFHPKGALSACKCIAQCRLNISIIHCQFFFLDPPLQCMGNVWAIYGQCMGNVWAMYGQCMGNVWAMYGQFMGNVWAMYGQCMGNIWAMFFFGFFIF